MENASKALLIAAAVLVVILIIAFGMTIMNSSTGTTDQVTSTMSSTEAQAFNSQFNAYVGTQKGAAIRNLVVAVRQSNIKNPTHPVNINGAAASGYNMSGILDNTAYTVTCTYDQTSGYITNVAIATATAGS